MAKHTTMTISTTQAHKGDLITHLDGAELGAPRKVLKVEPSNRTQRFYELFLEPLIGDLRDYTVNSGQVPTITVQRPTRPPQTRVIRRICGNGHVTSQGDGTWITEDGRFEIQRCDETPHECMEMHPMKITPALREAIRKNPEHYHEDAVEAVRTRSKGYTCPGGVTHYTGISWAVWDIEAEAYVSALEPTGTLKDMLLDFAEWRAKQDGLGL